VLAGIAVVGFGSFAYFGLTGLSDRSHLNDTCAPTLTCEPGEVSNARTKLAVADISLGIAIGALVAGVWVLLTQNGEPARPRVSGLPEFTTAAGGQRVRWRTAF
jgi:hypothetical protein